MGALELERLRQEIMEYRMEVKELRVEQQDSRDAYQAGFNGYSQEFASVSEALNEIKKLLYNDDRTGQKGLIQNFYELKTLVEKIIGKKESKQRFWLKVGSVASGGVLVFWALFKEFWHEIYLKLVK